MVQSTVQSIPKVVSKKRDTTPTASSRRLFPPVSWLVVLLHTRNISETMVTRLTLVLGLVSAALAAANGSDGTRRLELPRQEDLMGNLLGGGDDFSSNLFYDSAPERHLLVPSLAPSAFGGGNSTSDDILPSIRIGVPASNLGWISSGGGGGGGEGGHGGDDFGGGGGMRRRSKTYQNDFDNEFDMNEFLPHDVLLEFMGVPCPDVIRTGWAQVVRHGEMIVSHIRNFVGHIGDSLHSVWVSLWQHSSDATHQVDTAISQENTPAPEPERTQVLYRDLEGRTRSVCLDSTSTVADLKCKIEEDTGVPVWSQFLSDGRRVLENDQSVSPYHNSNRIDLRLRIRGGTKPSIRVTVSAGELSPDFEDRDGSIVIASSSNNSQFNEGDIVKSITSGATSIDDLAPFNAAGLSLLSNQAFLNTVRVFGVVRKDRDPSTQWATLAMSSKPSPSSPAKLGTSRLETPSTPAEHLKRNAGSQQKSPHQTTNYSPEKKRQGATNANFVQCLYHLA